MVNEKHILKELELITEHLQNGGCPGEILTSLIELASGMFYSLKLVSKYTRQNSGIKEEYKRRFLDFFESNWEAYA